MTYRSRKLRLHKRALPIKGKNLGGDNNDANRYFRCKQCGAIVDSHKASIGDGDGRVVKDYAFEDRDRILRFPSYIMQKDGYVDGQVNYATMITVGHVDHDHEGILEIGPDGNPRPIRHDHYPVNIGSCWNCGSMNWR